MPGTGVAAPAAGLPAFLHPSPKESAMHEFASARLLTLLGLAALAVPAAQAQTPPKENHGVSPSAATTVDLGPELNGIDGRQLRMRVITIEPGGEVALHSHRGRPAVAYCLEGELTEHIEGAPSVVHRPGDTWTEAQGVVHWAQNRGSVRARVLAVDVFTPN